jgi:hypothetical protein
LVVALFYFVQMQGSVRYTRQTLDEIEGPENARGARWRYVWVAGATVWAFLVASGQFRDCPGSLLVALVGGGAVAALFWGTHLQRVQKKDEAEKRAIEQGPAYEPDDPDGPAWGCWTALGLGVVLSAVNALTIGVLNGYEYAFGAALAGAAAITALSLMAPTLAQRRNKKRYEKRSRVAGPAVNSSSGEAAGN